MKTLLSNKLLLAALGAVVIAALAITGAVVLGGGKQLSPSQAREAARGWTDKVTVPMYSSDQYRPSVPRPAQLPPMIRAEGPCRAAMDAVRDFQDANPSGLSLSGAAATKLAGLLRNLGPGDPSAACSDTLAQRFRLQELDPWLTWQPAAGAAITPGHDPHPTGSKPSGKPSGKHATPTSEKAPVIPTQDPAPTDPGTAKSSR